jgi:membrane complex biogenesis BtpA family protein
VAELVDQAVREARLYREHGLDGVIVENMHDTPYVSGVGPEVTACMTRVCGEVRQAIGGDLPLGIQILSGANREALAVAKAAGADFVRVEGFVFSHVGDEGWMDSCAGDLLRYRRNIGADNVLVFTDIKKKHR